MKTDKMNKLQDKKKLDKKKLDKKKLQDKKQLQDKKKLYNMHRIIILGILLIFLSTVIETVDSANISETDNYLATSINHPNMYINTNEIEYIKEKVRTNQQPWKDAYDLMISEADNSLNVPIQNVLGGNTPPSGDVHDFYTENLYLTDGVPNPNADRTDYVAASKMGRAVRNLGLGYTFTGDVIYADKAIQLINAWTVTPSTKMNPTFTNGQSQIDLGLTMPAMFYGADLVWNYPDWNPSDKATFKAWASQMIDSAKSWSRSNNFENWRLVFISSASVIAEDSSSFQYAFDRWKDIIPNQMNLDGSMRFELTRTNSLSYSIMTINAMIQTAEIARHHGVDLYNYELADGRGLEKAFDFLAPYLANPQSWPYPQMATYTGASAAAYELAYAFKQKAIYRNVIDRYGRPMYESMIMGSVTLTHANANIAIIGPTPVITPTPIGGPTPTPTPIISITPPTAASNPKVTCYKRSRR